MNRIVHELLPSTRFLESLDSARTVDVPAGSLAKAPSNSEQIQAELEVLLTYLLGDRILLSQNQGFDSAIFLSIMGRAIHPDIKSERLFNLKLSPEEPAHQTFHAMVVGRLLDKTFHLSLLGNRDDNFERHREIAENLKMKRYDKVIDKLPNGAGQAIVQTVRYFGNRPLSHAKPPELTLSQRMHAFMYEPMDQQQPTIAANMDQILELRKAFIYFADWLEQAKPDDWPGGDPFQKRSPFVKHGMNFLQTDGRFAHSDAGQLYEGASALISLNYNRVLANSVRADDGVFVPSASAENPYVVASVAVVEGIHAEAPKSLVEFDFSDDVVKWARTYDWVNLWSTARDVVRSEAFRYSVGELHNARKLFRAQNRTTQNPLHDYSWNGLQNAYDRHIDFVSTALNKTLGAIDISSKERAINISIRTIRGGPQLGAEFVANLLGNYVFPHSLTKSWAVGAALGYGAEKLLGRGNVPSRNVLPEQRSGWREVMHGVRLRKPTA